VEHLAVLAADGRLLPGVARRRIVEVAAADALGDSPMKNLFASMTSLADARSNDIVCRFCGWPP
jgi:hypothetical protein